MNRASPTRQRGSTLLPVTFVMVTIVGLSMGMMEHGLAAKTSIRHDETSAAAMELAEVALAKAEMELSGGLDLDGNGIGVVEGALPGAGSSTALQYEVVYEQSATDPAIHTLRAIGQANLSVRRATVDLRIAEGHRFTHALYATRKLRMEDRALTASYDSRDAALPPDEQSMARLGRAAFESGHTGAGGDIELRDRVYVRGDARPGPGARLEVEGGDSSDVRITGETAPVAEALDVPLPPRKDFERALAENDNDGISWTADTTYRRSRYRLTSDGQAILVFPGGTYFFNELTIRGDAKVVFQGPTKIYVTGKLVIETNAEFNVPGRPSDVLIVAHAYDVHESHRNPSDPIKFNRGVRAALTLYAPGRDVKLDRRAVVRGAIVGRDIEAENDTEMHFDLALEAEEPAGGAVERVAWREER